MTQEPPGRTAETVATVIRGIGAFVAAFAALRALGYFPAGADLVLAGAVGIVMLISTSGAVAVYLAVIALPLLHANALMGAFMLVLGFAGLKLLSDHNGGWFFVLALSTVAAKLRAAWAIPILAGFYVGGVEGFVAGLAACLLLELLMIMLGPSAVDAFGMVGPKAAKGLPLYVPPAKVPQMTDFSWIAPRLLSTPGLMRTIRALAAAFRDNPALIAQPAAWGAVGVIAGITMKGSFRKVAGVAIALVVALFALMVGIGVAMGPKPFAARQYVFAATMGVLVLVPWTGAALAMAKRKYRKEAVAPAAAPAPAPITPEAIAAAAMAAAAAPAAQVTAQREQDVVELLRTIAEAQDVIKEKFTQTATVLLTDMKEFSKMTHEQGSVPSAATVQRYRDLLEPVIEKRNGQGKPTGGDGMLAAFTSPDDAIEAAVDMQRALYEYNTAHPQANQILIRIGLDTGEVVFDKESNPFIGDALNVAGQVFISKDTMEAAERAAQLTWHYHGTRKLRGISEDVTIYEILWAPGQQPKAPDLKRL
jgi:class 3 adenylate cyclase